MIKISIDQPTYQALKNDIMLFVNRYIEVEPQKSSAHSNPETHISAAPPSIPDYRGTVRADQPAYPTPAPAQEPMKIPRIPTTQNTFTAAAPQQREGLDSKGQAWNPEIHSSSKNFNKDGTWRVKRGLDPAVLAAAKAKPNVAQQHVDSHNRLVQEIPQPTVAPPAFSAPPPVPTPQAPAPQAAPAQTVQPTTETVIRGNDIYAVPNAQGVHAHTYASFKDNLIPVFASLIAEGRIDQAYVDSLKKYFGIKELWNLFTDDKKLSELFENFCGANLIQRIEG